MRQKKTLDEANEQAVAKRERRLARLGNFARGLREVQQDDWIERVAGASEASAAERVKLVTEGLALGFITFRQGRAMLAYDVGLISDMQLKRMLAED